MGLIEDAQDRRAERSRSYRPIDYARMSAIYPKQKAALTRAVKTGDPEKVAAVCKKAVAEWNEIGAWPDDWSRWRNALNDLLPWHQQVELEDL